VCVSSCTLLTDDLAITGLAQHSGGQIFDNALGLPYAERASFWNSWGDGLDEVWNGHRWVDPGREGRMELDIVLVRISDGAMHHLAHRHHINDRSAFNPDEDDVHPEERHFVSFGNNPALSQDMYNISPWYDDIIDGTNLQFDCKMTAERRLRRCPVEALLPGYVRDDLARESRYVFR